jgi:C-terminal processing protease CtpA/Prc
MKPTLSLLLWLVALAGYAQSSPKFNLGFEDHSAKASLPEGWMKWGEYDLFVDSQAHTGDKAVKITSNPSGSAFGSVAYRIPANYAGDSIRLEGYLRTEDVAGGFAGLLLRVDGASGPLVFDNMQERKITGTNDWRRYAITLPYPADAAENIYVAGILAGQGTAWFDDFVLTIDGVEVQVAPEAVREVAPAQLDTAFDKGSGIDFPELTPALADNLVLLGRVWGFLKYHHPAIASGAYNWDYELFRFLPGYLAAERTAERDRLLVEWIAALGELEPCPDCEPAAAEAFLQPDLAWLAEQSPALREQLNYVYARRNQGEHYYLELAPNVGNPVFQNEQAHPNMAYPDAGYRLLALYRYWNMIQYFFPYRHLMDTDWNTALERYLPLFLEATSELEYELAAVQLIGDIQDTHANLWGGADEINAWKGKYFPPVHLRFIEDQLVVVDYYNPELKAEVGLEIGDVITRIDGRPVTAIVEETRKYYPASNEPTRLRDVALAILRADTTGRTINVVRATGQEEALRIPLYPGDSLNLYGWYPERKEKSYEMLAGNIGYVTLQNIEEADIPIIKEEFKHTRGIIIDIRNYPSTFVPFSLGSYFVSSATPFVKFTQGSVANPGQFVFTPNLEIPSQGETYSGKLVVLVNELSQSQAEYTAMAFRAGANTTIVGSTTAGADGNVSQIMLPGRLRTMISGIGVYYPDGGETQRIGIVPDVEVRPTIAGVRAGKDEVLEKAIELILEK